MNQQIQRTLITMLLLIQAIPNVHGNSTQTPNFECLFKQPNKLTLNQQQKECLDKLHELYKETQQRSPKFKPKALPSLEHTPTVPTAQQRPVSLTPEPKSSNVGPIQSVRLEPLPKAEPSLTQPLTWSQRLQGLLLESFTPEYRLMQAIINHDQIAVQDLIEQQHANPLTVLKQSGRDALGIAIAHNNADAVYYLTRYVSSVRVNDHNIQSAEDYLDVWQSNERERLIGHSDFTLNDHHKNDPLAMHERIINMNRIVVLLWTAHDRNPIAHINQIAAAEPSPRPQPRAKSASTPSMKSTSDE